MAHAALPIPFGDRLRDKLAERGEQATQAWLAKRSGVDSSLISRLIANGRAPTLETLQALAPALEIDVADLVAGTDAESRLAAGPEYVRLSDYQEAVGKVIEYEASIRDLDARVRTLDEAYRKEHSSRCVAQDEVATLRAECELNKTELAETRLRCTLLQTNIEEYQAALKRAISEFSALKTHVDELRAELGKTGQSSKVNTILAGIAAVASVATMANFLRKDVAPKQSGARSRKKGADK